MADILRFEKPLDFDTYTPESSGDPQMDAEFIIQLLEMY